MLFAGWSLARGNRSEALLLGLAGVGFVYACLAIFSVALEKFVVYGRLSRQLAPFCCLLAALLLERLWSSSRRGRQVAAVLLALVAIQAAFNFRPPLVQVFPPEFHRLAAAATGSAGPGKYEVLNAEFIWPEPRPAPKEGWTVIGRPHPMQYLPLQYEGYDPDQRRKVRSADISMRLHFTPTGPLIFEDGFESGGTAAWSLVLGAPAGP